jgi:hypothetical protein
MFVDRLTMPSRSKRTLLAALALPVLAFALLLSSHALQRCVGDGVVRADCCCSMGAPASPGSQAGIGERCCCDSVVVGPTTTTSAETPKAAPDPRPVLVAVLGADPQESEAFVDVSNARGERSSRPPNVPLFVLKRSFLI